jgi:hypothetical protein
MAVNHEFTDSVEIEMEEDNPIVNFVPSDNSSGHDIDNDPNKKTKTGWCQRVRIEVMNYFENGNSQVDPLVMKE